LGKNNTGKMKMVINRFFVWARFWLPNESLQGDKPNGEFTEPTKESFLGFQVQQMQVQRLRALIVACEAKLFYCKCQASSFPIQANC